MTKCNKTLLIISLVLVFSISITFSFVSLHNSVNADTIEENLVYTLNNVIFPIALNNQINYTQFVNAYIQFNCVVDIHAQTLSINNVRLIFISNIFKDISGKNFDSNITTPYGYFESELLFVKSGTNTITLGTDFFSVSGYQTPSRHNVIIKTKGLLSDSYTELNTKMSFTRSNNPITDINYVKLSSFEGVHSGNEYGLYNFLTYYDTNNNFISIGFNVYNLLVNSSNYPMLSTSYADNLAFCSEIKNYYPIKIAERNYYFNALTNAQINSESYQKGFSEGQKQGELDGFDKGYGAGQDYGYDYGYEEGKKEGIALKGENVWSNSNEFIKNIFVSIFDILSIEILPNVSLGTFVVIPLIFSVLFFIVKVAKGGD